VKKPHVPLVFFLAPVLFFIIHPNAMGALENDPAPRGDERTLHVSLLDRNDNRHRSPSNQMFMAEGADSDMLFERMKAFSNGASDAKNGDTMIDPEIQPVEKKIIIPSQRKEIKKNVIDQRPHGDRVSPTSPPASEFREAETPTGTETAPQAYPASTTQGSVGSLIVKSTIKDSIITIDRMDLPAGSRPEDVRVYRGRAPFELHHTPQGSYEIRMSRAGYREKIETVAVRSGVIVTVNFRDEQIQDATIKNAGGESDNLESLRRKIRDEAEKPVQEVPVASVTPPEELTPESNEPLRDLPVSTYDGRKGTLIVRSDIRDAVILIHRKDVPSGPTPEDARIYFGKAPFESHNMVPGKYEIRVNGRDSLESIKTVDVRSGQLLILDVTKQ